MLDNESQADDLTPDVDPPEGEPPQEPETDDPPPEAELVITIGDDDAGDDDDLGEEIDTSGMDEKEARTVHKLRDNLRQKIKEAKQLERKARAAEAALAARDVKPKIEEKPYPKPIDYGYDDALHEAAVLEWTENQAAVKVEKAKQQAAITARTEKLQQQFEAYTAGKKTLRVADFDTAEAAVMADLSNEQQQAILECATDPAKLVYALGNSPKARRELAAIDDPRLFGFRLAKIEGEIKVTQKTPPPVETRLSGGAGAGASGGSLAAQLKEAERRAEINGIRTEVIRIKAQAKAAGVRL
jgi:hypothetical protein